MLKSTQIVFSSTEHHCWQWLCSACMDGAMGCTPDGTMGAPLQSPAMTPQMWDSLRRAPAVAGRGDRRPTLPCAPFARTLPTSASSDPSASSHIQRNVLSLTHSKASGTWSYASSIRQDAIEHAPLPRGLPAKLWQLPARLSLTSPQSTPCEGQGRLWSFLKQVRSIK